MESELPRVRARQKLLGRPYRTIDSILFILRNSIINSSY